ncbi:MAG TPA: archease [Thermoanaerobaculia bacterium]|nr:archease [Thermoanaerobaculia bacterium]
MYDLIPHIADVRLRVAASSREELFADAMHGLFAVMHARAAGEPVARTIDVEDSADLTSLLVDFLNEVLHRAQVAGELFTGATFTRLDETNVRAELTGVAPAEFEEDVKAVTYHEADVRYEDGMWRTMLVFDL